MGDGSYEGAGSGSLMEASAEAGDAMLLQATLPGKELFHRKGIPAAHFFQRDEAILNGGNDHCLAADHPSDGIARR